MIKYVSIKFQKCLQVYVVSRVGFAKGEAGEAGKYEEWKRFVSHVMGLTSLSVDDSESLGN